MWAFPQQIVGLSFKLHKELADEYNGAAEWGYRGLKLFALKETFLLLIYETSKTASKG